MTKAEQIRMLTAIIAGPNLLTSARPDQFIEKAKNVAERIYKSVKDESYYVRNNVTGSFVAEDDNG